jgi:hypothetical protein
MLKPFTMLSASAEKAAIGTDRLMQRTNEQRYGNTIDCLEHVGSPFIQGFFYSNSGLGKTVFLSVKKSKDGASWKER